MTKKYTEEHRSYIAANVKGTSYRELTEMFNKHFGLSVEVSSLMSFCFKNRLLNERDCRLNTGHIPTQFKKGHVPYNKGKKGIGGFEPTQFKKGMMPWNYKQVGTERINTEGYADIKIADPNKWKAKHIIIWEEVNGPVPDGHCLIFADGNKLNVSLDNLLLISRRELVMMNKHKLISSNPELTKTGVVVADIHLKIAARKRKK